MPKNYYLILGVASDATSEEVKTAFRRRALELHPDHSGLGSGPFIELQEAYGVLADPERRRSYDREHRRPAARRRPWGPSPEPIIPGRIPAEPLRDPTGLGPTPRVSLTDSFQHFAPSFGELFDRLWSNFDSVTRPKSESLASLNVEVVLSVQQARAGGVVQIEVPARATCPVCGGCGALLTYICWNCSGRGAVITEYPIDVEYPPGTRDGFTVRIPLEQLGIENFFMVILFRVSDQT